MNIILLSGGSGKRLWPLSNEDVSKQFLKVFKKKDGAYESMLQRTYRLIREADNNVCITIATSENQVVSVKNQIGESVDVSIEPCRRDTFPAIALATTYLHDVKGMREDEVVVVCPVDAYVEANYFQMLNKLAVLARRRNANLYLMGVEPTYPSEKYGYIIPTSPDFDTSVLAFKEKPNASDAEEYIKQGALWNSGVFAYKLKYILNIAKDIFGTASYKKLFFDYANLTKISFDYAVVEKEKRIHVIRFCGVWKDIGTWNTLTETMSDEVTGNAVAVSCENTNIVNGLSVPLIALGLKNIVVVAMSNGILVTEKAYSNKLKDYAPEQRPLYEKRIWGEYKILDYRLQEDERKSLTKYLIIYQGYHISYQRHAYRTEIWTIVRGTGKLILDDVVKSIGRGDTVYIETGMRHAIAAEMELHIIEVQIGEVLSEEDIERLEWDWSGID